MTFGDDNDHPVRVSIMSDTLKHNDMPLQIDPNKRSFKSEQPDDLSDILG